MAVRRIVILCGGILAAGLVWGGLRVGATGEQTSAGVYSEAQAKRGADLYQAQQCGVCHGPTLGGIGPNPPLTGDNFLTVYGDKSVRVLFDKVQRSMPQSNPGSLTPEQTADLLAYILSLNKYPAGNEELPADRDKLKTIMIPRPAK